MPSDTRPRHDCHIRDEAPGDAAAIAAVISAAFKPAGGGRAAEATLVEALRAAGALSLSLVAESPDGGLVGHVAFSPVTIEGRTGGRLLGLAPLAVMPAWHGRGLGRDLVAAGLAQARAQGYDLVFVLGEPAYYRRFGFRPAGELGIAWAHPAPSEAFMVLALQAAGVSPRPGVLRYHPAFDRFAE